VPELLPLLADLAAHSSVDLLIRSICLALDASCFAVRDAARTARQDPCVPLARFARALTSTCLTQNEMVADLSLRLRES
jgi:hypothetical protein